VDQRQDELRGLVVELRAALEAGGTTSGSVRETIAALDSFVARFDRPEPRPPGAAPRPFDITEYTEALRQLSDTAQQLQVLIGAADGKVPALTQLSDRAAERMTAVVDHLYWRLVQLVMVIAAAVVGSALLYRAVARRS
jgi:hypothetical protein